MSGCVTMDSSEHKDQNMAEEVSAHAASQELKISSLSTSRNAENNNYDDDTPDNTNAAANNNNNNNNNNSTPSWDHSSRKIMIQNMFKYHDTKQCRKMVSQWIAACNQAATASTISAPLSAMPIAVEKIKKPPKENWMTVTVTHPDMAQPLIEYINSNNIRNKHGKPIFAKLAEEDRAADRKRERQENDDDGCGGGGGNENDSSDRANISKRQRSSEPASSSTVFTQARRPVTADEVRNATTPLWKLSLPEQHSHKMKLLINKCAVKIVKEIKARYQYV